MRKIRQPQYIRSRQSHITFQRSNARKRKRKGVDNHASHSSVQTPESESGKVLKCDYAFRNEERVRKVFSIRNKPLNAATAPPSSPFKMLNKQKHDFHGK